MQSMDWGQLIKQAENAGGGEPVPANEYTIAVAACEGKLSSTGKPMLKVKGKIIGGPYDGKTLWTNLTLSVENDTAVSIFMRHLAAFGLGAEYFATNPPFEQVAQALIGRSAIWDVKVGSYQGRPKNDVNDIKPAGIAPGAGVVPTPQVPQVPQAVPVPAAAPSPVPTAPVPQAPPAPAPAPAPVPPVAVPQAAPAPAPAPAPVPAPAADVPGPDSSTPAPPEPPF